MKKLFLHIGSHKTGTTSIQLACIKNIKILQDQGYDYFSKDRKGRYIKGGNASKWVSRSNDEFRESATEADFFVRPKDMDNLVNQLSESAFDKLIMSAEDFSFLLDEDNILQLKEQLCRKFDVTIICYIRRQDKLAISHFQQVSKRKRSPSRFFYNGGTSALPTELERCDKYLDFNHKLSKWIDAFGRDNVIVKIFEKNKLINGDAVNDFMSLVGVDDKNIESIKVNESNGFERIKIGHLMNRSNINSAFAKLIKSGIDNNNPILPTREEAKEFYQRYQESNVAFNKRFNICEDYPDIFGEDFSRYPDISTDKWTEENTNQAILNILDSLTFTKLFKLILVNSKSTLVRKFHQIKGSINR